jgi:RNA polymerase sigma-70 factor, ECF subfamily
MAPGHKGPDALQLIKEISHVIFSMSCINQEVNVMEQYVDHLWLKFHKALLNYIRKNISNPEDAKDLLQNVFLKIHTHIHRLKEKEKVTSWIYQITRNTIIDTFRSNGKKKIESLPLLDGKTGMTLDDHEESWKKEIGLLLIEMLEELPEKYRSVLKWYEFENLTHKEIAMRLGISVSGSKTRVQRSREKLKELLLCGCRREVEGKESKSENLPQPCSHLVKIGENNWCFKRLHDA